jgi:hypothetical protein
MGTNVRLTLWRLRSARLAQEAEGLVEHASTHVLIVADCLVKQPISPVRGARVAKVNLLVGFDIEPVATHKPSTGKSDTVGTRAVDNRELQIATERCSIYHLPFHDRLQITYQANRL